MPGNAPNRPWQALLRQRQTTHHRAALNAQRLLKPVLVVNLYADQLSFRDDQTCTRRDHMKYLTLIRAIALLHQHQREVKIQWTHHGNSLPISKSAKAILLSQSLPMRCWAHLDELPPRRPGAC